VEALAVLKCDSHVEHLKKETTAPLDAQMPWNSNVLLSPGMHCMVCMLVLTVKQGQLLGKRHDFTGELSCMPLSLQHYDGLSVVQDVANQDVAYENIMNTPEAQLHMLSQALNITEKVLHDSIHLAHEHW